MKTIKEGTERRKEILNVSKDLFIRKGYDQTSINDILKVVDIAKGTFYYYFSSKQEVLEAIIIEIVEEGVFKAKKIVKDDSLPLLAKIILSMKAQAPEYENADNIKEVIHKPENVKLERLYLQTMLRLLTPVLLDPIEEGLRDGFFKTKHPKESIESILILGYMIFDCQVVSWDKKEYTNKVAAFINNVERILGAQEGSLNQLMDVM